MSRDASLDERQRASPAIIATEVTEIDDFSCGSTNSSRRDACQPQDRSDTGKHRLFCNLERRDVEHIASLAAAQDEEER